MRLTEQKIAAIDQKVKDGKDSLVLLAVHDSKFCGVFTTVAKLLKVTTKPPPLFTEEEWGPVPYKTWLVHSVPPYYRLREEEGRCYPVHGNFNGKHKEVGYFAYLCPVNAWL